MEIIVDAAGYPTEQISRNSHDYRPLGLGYANLGALLMDFGLPYDSDAGRAFAATLTAILCGDAYAQSARIAADCPPLGAATPLTQSADIQGGACPGFYVNREPFLDVIRMHRAEVNNIGKSLKANIPSGKDSAAVSSAASAAKDAAGFTVPNFTDLKAAAQKAWDDALTLGEQHGFRNSQTTVLAPTGTIGFMMDCDTTGIEPDLALVKYKKLVGGGMIKIVNNTVPGALFKLGYTDAEVQGIVNYIDATGTIEGAPQLKPEHLAVFDCSFKPAKGSRTISWLGHVKMMAATQPFLSGAISKTVNLPNDCTVQEIADAYTEAWRLGLKAVAIYRDGSKGTQPLNVSADKDKKDEKAGAPSSPTQSAKVGSDLNTAPVAAGQTEIAEAIAAEKALTSQALTEARSQTEAAQHHIQILTEARDRIQTRLAAVESQLNTLLTNSTADLDHSNQQGPPRAIRHRLPAERASITHKFGIAGHEGYVTVGLYPNGCPGEIFIRMAKEGSTISGLMDSFATAISLALQHGVPLKVLAEKFAHTRFEPSGWTGNEEIGYAKSIMDYLFRWMQLRFLSGHQLSLFQGLNPTASGTLSAATQSANSGAPSLSLSFPEQSGVPNGRMPDGVQRESASAPAQSSLSHTIPLAGTINAPDNTVQSAAFTPTLTDTLEQDFGSGSPNIPEYADRTPPQSGIAPDLSARSGLDPLGLSSPERGSASRVLATEDRGIYHAATAMKSLYDMGDAPSCSTCGSIMTRNGSCYRCMECGSTSGCS